MQYDKPLYAVLLVVRYNVFLISYQVNRSTPKNQIDYITAQSFLAQHRHPTLDYLLRWK